MLIMLIMLIGLFKVQL